MRMRTACTAAAAIVVVIGSGAFAAPAISSPLVNVAPISVAQTATGTTEVVNVGWRGGRHYRGHHHGWRHRRHSGWGPAVGGFVAGAAIGSAIANSRAQAGQYDAYCEQRFKSYDPQSGTYLGYDGQRHPCP